MKPITNYMNATVFDIEADGFLANATKIHVLSFCMAGGRKDSIRGDDHARLRSFFLWHRDEDIPLVAHNGICYDIPVVERLLGIDLTGLMVVDTLGLSWYLNTKRKSHGLDSFHEDYGIAKPKIDDWENLTYEEYKHRCEEDVKINRALYDDLCDRLNRMYSIAQGWINRDNVGGTRFKDELCYIDTLIGRPVEQAVDSVLTFLMYKMDTIRDREKARWKADLSLLTETEKELSETLEQARTELHAVMPKVPKYVNAKRPKVLEKKDGSPSAAAIRWFKLGKAHNSGEVDEFGTRTAIGVDGENIKRLKGYDEPNANSSDQVKKFLFSHGWKPTSFKYVIDKADKQAWAESGFKKQLKPKARAVPQITVDGDNGKELCQSVELLIEKEPAIASYGRYTLIKHRLEMVTRFLNSVDEDGYLVAGVGGWTNTLRDCHKAPLANLPGASKPYGKNIRGSLTCDEDEILLGTDLSSLEDRVKHHFLLPIDPDYVATMMADDYDPHLETALASGLITQEEFDMYKKGEVTANAKAGRSKGKTTNYASVYGVGAETLARNSGMSVKEAESLIKGYWEINWGVKQIAEEQVVFDFEYKVPATGETLNQRWLINPINGLCYECRKDSDRFSTLCQGTGSFFFDCWVSNVRTLLKEEGHEMAHCFSAHDEFVARLLKGEESFYSNIVETALEEVNCKYKLRRKLGCDIQYDNNYAGIH